MPTAESSSARPAKTREQQHVEARVREGLAEVLFHRLDVLDGLLRVDRVDRGFAARRRRCADSGPCGRAATSCSAASGACGSVDRGDRLGLRQAAQLHVADDADDLAQRCPGGTSDVRRLPTASSPGQKRWAIASLTRTTGGARPSSAAVKSRPRTSADAERLERAGREHAHGDLRLFGEARRPGVLRSRSAASIRRRSAGAVFIAPAASTPGSARTRSRARSKNALRASGVAYFASGSET